MQIFPSLTSQNITVLEKQIQQLEPFCAGFHIDIMDGIFVNNSMGSAHLTNQIAQLTNKPLWVHLMTHNPSTIITHITLPPESIVAFHATAHYDYEKVIDLLAAKNMRPSLAISPQVPLQTITQKLYALDHITLMSVEPGASGQLFIEETYARLEIIHAFKASREKQLTIAIDGGVNSSNIQKLREHGATQVAVCSAIFNHANPEQALLELTTLAS